MKSNDDFIIKLMGFDLSGKRKLYCQYYIDCLFAYKQ